MILKALFTLFLLVVTLTSSATSESTADYCVADLSLPKGPAGFPCKNPANLTADDFVFSGFRVGGDTNNIYKASTTFATDVEFPGLNGLGLSMVRLDLGVGGVVPLHTHRVSEVILMIEGTILTGFIDSNNTPFYKTLKKGDIMIFPQSMLHFQVNVGSTPALAFVSLNSANPGFQTTDNSLFGNDMPTELIQKIMLLDGKQVNKLKKLISSSG